MDADGEEAEGAGPVGWDEVREGTAGGLLLPEHRQPARAQVDGLTLPPGRKESDGETDGNAAVADHPVQHGAAFRRQFRVLLHAPHGTEHRPVEEGSEFFQRQFRKRNVFGN